jgi:hypothetical protein
MLARSSTVLLATHATLRGASLVLMPTPPAFRTAQATLRASLAKLLTTPPMLLEASPALQAARPMLRPT